MKDYRFRSHFTENDLDNLLKPILTPNDQGNSIIAEELADVMTANEFYKFDSIKTIKENDPRIEGVTKLEDINIEDMELTDKIDLAKKALTNIFDNKRPNESMFLNTFIEFKKLSEKFIYEIDPEWVDETEQEQPEEQPPEFEEALQNLNEPETEELPEEEIEPTEEEGADQEVTETDDEEELINKAFS